METFRRARVRRAFGDRGMTLIELLIVVLILSLASDAMFSLLLTSFQVYGKGDLATQVQQGARISADRIVRDLRQSRTLINGVTRTAGATSLTFNTSCTTPQISVVLPHLAAVTVTDGANTYSIFATDPNASGAVPYDGWDVSYYLAAAPGSATPNTTGPYLIRASYDLVGGTGFTLATVANNITGLALGAGGSCPTTATREFTVTLTAYQQTGGQVTATGYQQSTTVVAADVSLRNQ